jgi:hypothetical protein
MPQLLPEHRSFEHETDRLLRLLASTSTIETAHRRVIAEIIHLRLAILMENHLKVIFGKICCAAPYLDGTIPLLQGIGHRSIAAAFTSMKSLKRTKEFNTTWNDGPSIRKGVEHLVDPTDHCIRTMLNYGAFLTDVRYVRNHIAHRNDGTRRNFRTLLRRYYGAVPHGVTSGVFLLSERISRPPVIVVHIRTARVLIRELVKG